MKLFSLSQREGENRRIRRADGSAHDVRVKNVREYYEAHTDAYLAGFGEVFQGSRPASTDDLLSSIGNALDLQAGMRVLDAGCGVAGPATWLAKRYDVHIEALTLSPSQAAIARGRVEERDLTDRICVTQGDFHDLGALYAPASFDRVIFLESLCHAGDYRRVLEGAHRTLRSGGGLYIKDFYVVDQSRDAVRAANQRADLERLNALYHLELPRLGDLLNLIGECGFLVKFARMPEFEPVYSPWAKFEQITGRHWAPQSGAPGEVIQGIEIFAWKA